MSNQFFSSFALTFVAAAVCGTAAPSSAVAKPTVLALQGALRANAGGPVADGDYPFGVSLYAEEKGGAPLYSEKFLGISVKGGIFAIELGSQDPTKVLEDTAFIPAPGKAPVAWVGVQIGADPELARVPLRPTPATLHARAADLAFGLECSGCVVAGAIAANAVTGEKIAAGAVDAKHVAFAYAGSKTKGGPAELAELAALAKVAETAKNAEYAASADEAKTASKLLCTGCIGAAHVGATFAADLVTAKQFAAVAVSGKYDDLAGGPDLTGYGALAKANAWGAQQVLKGGADFQQQEAVLFRFQNVAKDPVACSDKNIGLTYYNTGDNTLRVCNGKDFIAFANAVPPGAKENPAATCAALKQVNPGAASGAYWIKPKSVAYLAYCELQTDGGGWTMALNLDTSDGHVSWWADAIWLDGKPYGDVATPFEGDHKSDAFMDLDSAKEVLVVVHEQGSVKGWKVWTRPDMKSLHALATGGDNQVFGATVKAESIGALPTKETLVRTSKALYFNHCVQEGGTCTGPSAGSPDGDRIASNESAPAGNSGGGLGNWHDMQYCCAGKAYGSKSCNGSAFRTTSEAQSGWAGCYSGQAGYFGTDTFGAGTNQCSDTNCDASNWAQPNGTPYDYAVFLR